MVTGRFVTYNAKQVFKVEFAGGVVLVGTPKHPVWSLDRVDWIGLGELRQGERVAAHDGPAVVHALSAVACDEPVYNIEVHGEHVYEVTDLGILVHNTDPDCARLASYAARLKNGEKLTPEELADYRALVFPRDTPSAKTVHDLFVQQVRPGAREMVFETPWSSGKGFGSRRFDDFDLRTGTAFEGNTTPWSQMTHEQLSRKLDQVASDFALLKTNPRIKRIIWFGTEPLPTTGLGAQLREALKMAGIEYWVITP